MKVVFDTSVWVDHLRHGALTPLLPIVRGHFQIWMDAVVAAELLAGCRSRIERGVVEKLISPIRKSGRLRVALDEDLALAGTSISRLRERGLTLKNPGAALLDAIVAVGTIRLGALLVSENRSDFEKLALVMPLQTETLAKFSDRIS